jgi:hypothetical protein
LSCLRAVFCQTNITIRGKLTSKKDDYPKRSQHDFGRIGNQRQPAICGSITPQKESRRKRRLMIKTTVSVALSGVHKTVLFAKKSTRSALFSRASARSGERRTRHPGKLGASNSIG